MKEMRYFLTIICWISVLSVGAQTLAEQPQTTFQSTSSMTGSGSMYSANPMLSTDGSATYEGASYAPAKAPSGPRRSVFDDFSEDMPLGDAFLPLLLMVLLYGGYRGLRRKEIINHKS